VSRGDAGNPAWAKRLLPWNWMEAAPGFEPGNGEIGCRFGPETAGHSADGSGGAHSDSREAAAFAGYGTRLHEDVPQKPRGHTVRTIDQAIPKLLSGRLLPRLAARAKASGRTRPHPSGGYVRGVSIRRVEAAADTVLGFRVILIGLLMVGPCCSLFSARACLDRLGRGHCRRVGSSVGSPRRDLGHDGTIRLHRSRFDGRHRLQLGGRDHRSGRQAGAAPRPQLHTV
jgi:hypothetical protein